MSTPNRNIARKPAALKVVPANADQGAPDPAEIASGLAHKALKLSDLFRSIIRVNASEITNPCSGEEDPDITVLAEIGIEMAGGLAEALDVFHLDLSGRPRPGQLHNEVRHV